MAWILLAIAWIGAVAGPPVAWEAWRRLGPKRPRLRIVGLILFAAIYLPGVWAFLIEPETMVVKRVAIVSPAWRGPPLRIGVLSDTHVGNPHVDAARVARVVDRLAAEAPDIVLYVGDYVGGRRPAAVRSPRARAEVARGLAELGVPRPPLGRFAVLGNHDWWYDGRGVEAGLWAAGVPVMENYAQRIDRLGGAFWVAGLADYASPRERPSAAAALAAVPAREPVIVLSHWPDGFAQVPARVALTIAGHSHCGQANLPLIGRPVLPSAGARRWPCGRYDVGGRILYVTGGLGTSLIPARIGAPPEIAILTLRAPSAPVPTLPNSP